MNKIKKSINNIKNSEFAVKYLNIILAVVIVSMIAVLSIFLKKASFNFLGFDLAVAVVILPCIFGGILAGFIRGGIHGILGGTIVGALSFCIWVVLYSTLISLITSPEPFSFVLIIFWGPVFLLIGGVLGAIGSVIGVIIKMVAIKSSRS